MTERTQNADFSQKTADFRRFALSPGNSSIGKPQETADVRRKPKSFAENRRKPRIGLRNLRSVTFSSALFPPDSRRLSIHFDRLSVLFNQFQSASVSFNQFLRGPNWGLFVGPEIRAFTGFGARFLHPFPKSLVTVRYYSNTKMPVNCR